jgi:hypothetical protein
MGDGDSSDFSAKELTKFSPVSKITAKSEVALAFQKAGTPIIIP